MSSEALHTLLALPKSERRSMLQQYVTDEFKRVLLMEPDENPALDVSVFDLGLTSLGLETLKQRLEKHFNCALSSTELFNNPTIGHMLAYFQQRIFREEQVPVPIAPARAAEIEEHLLANAVLSGLYRAHGVATESVGNDDGSSGGHQADP